jgi:hypothetical protein
MKFLGALFGLVKNAITIGLITVCALAVLAVVMPDNFIQAAEYIKGLL